MYSMGQACSTTSKTRPRGKESGDSERDIVGYRRHSPPMSLVVRRAPAKENHHWANRPANDFKGHNKAFKEDKIGKSDNVG